MHEVDPKSWRKLSGTAPSREAYREQQVERLSIWSGRDGLNAAALVGILRGVEGISSARQTAWCSVVGDDSKDPLALYIATLGCLSAEHDQNSAHSPHRPSTQRCAHHESRRTHCQVSIRLFQRNCAKLTDSNKHRGTIQTDHSASANANRYNKAPILRPARTPQSLQRKGIILRLLSNR